MIQQLDISLAKGRIQVAYDRLAVAEDNLTRQFYRDTLHSAYYAAYTAIRVLLNLEHEEQKNHGKNVGNFMRHYIKTKVLDLKLSDYIKKLYENRDYGDYDLDFIPKHETVAEMVKNARVFVDEVYNYLNDKYFSKSEDSPT